MFDEVLFVLCQFFPVFGVLAEIDFINSPETSHLVFVHFPYVLVLDGQNDKAVGILLEQRLWDYPLSVLALAGSDDILWRYDLR